jgi:hypothetical protein
LGIIKYELDVYYFKHTIFDGIGSFTSEEVREMNKVQLAEQSERRNSAYDRPIRWAMFISTIISIVLLVIRRYYEMLWDKKYFQKFLHQPNGSLYFFYDRDIQES